MSKGWLRLAEPTPSTPELPDLDEGETACIRLALAGRQPALVLSDFRISATVIATILRRVDETHPASQ